MYIRDVDIESLDNKHKYAKEINYASYCIEGLYLRCLGRNKVFSGQYWKAIVRLDDRVKDEHKLDDMVNVIAIDKSFDFENYISKGRQEKKGILLDALHGGIMDIARQKGWDVNPLLDAYNCCLAKNLHYERLLKDKYFQSPNKQHYAGVICVNDIDYLTVSIVFLDKKKNEIKREEILKTEPFSWSGLGAFGWENTNDTFFLHYNDYYPVDKEIILKASIK